MKPVYAPEKVAPLKLVYAPGNVALPKLVTFPEKVAPSKNASWRAAPLKSKSCSDQLISASLSRCAAMVLTMLARTSPSLRSASSLAGIRRYAHSTSMHCWRCLGQSSASRAIAYTPAAGLPVVRMFPSTAILPAGGTSSGKSDPPPMIFFGGAAHVAHSPGPRLNGAYSAPSAIQLAAARLT